MESAVRSMSFSSTTVQSGSRKPKIPVGLRLVQWLFPRVEKLAPRVAQRWFVKLFFSPPRYPIPAAEMKFIEEADRFQLSIWEKTVSCYRWGEGPLIIFVHGWAGRASQFKTFIPFFTHAGFQVISFDAPAHGLTRGKETTIIDFKNTMLAIERARGKPYAVVAHSLGGAASLFAITEGMGIDKLVTLATPAVGEHIIQEFSQRLGASSTASHELKAFIQKKLHRPFDEFMASHFVKMLKPGLDWLIIHDTNDKEASVENALLLKNHYPGATLHTTNGLGHVRILKDEVVIKKSLAFIMQTRMADV
jgi:pimeloyl-ACP methyl ester carboxylesterase